MVPEWQAITGTVLALAVSTPFNAMCTWDAAVDAEGRVVIAEMGPCDGISQLQVHGGLLRDPPVRRFFDSYG